MSNFTSNCISEILYIVILKYELSLTCERSDINVPEVNFHTINPFEADGYNVLLDPNTVCQTKLSQISRTYHELTCTLFNLHVGRLV